MAEDKQQPVASEPQKAPKYEKDGDVKMTGVDNEDPIEGEPIKIYHFSIDKLSEDNARYWFHAIEKQLRTQYAWQAIELHARIRSEAYADRLVRKSNWQRIDMKADMIIEMGLTPSTVLEVKDQRNAGEKWQYLKKRFLKSSNTKKMMKLMRIFTSMWDESKHNEKEFYHALKQMFVEFKEMNGDNKIGLDDLCILQYLRALGDRYATLRESMMSSGIELTEDYVLGRVEDVMQLRKQERMENASRASQGRPRGPKCYECQKFGHKAAKCPNRQQENDNSRNHSSNSQSGRGRGRGNGQGSSRQNHGGRTAEEHDIAQPNEEYGGRAEEDCVVDCKVEEEYANRGHISETAGFIQEEAYRSSSHGGWVFDSGATSMSTGDRSIFEYMDPCEGTLKIASGTRMPIKGRGIVKIRLLNGQEARLERVIYVPGLVENLLSLEALHLAGYESRGSSRGYELLKNDKVVAYGKRIGRSTYLDAVEHKDALLVGPVVAKRTQYARLALSADEATAKKQELVHRRLGHPGRQRFNDCLEMMGLDRSEFRLGKSDEMLDDNCEICVMAKKHKMQSHIPVRKASRPLQRVYMDFWGPSRETMGDIRYFLSLIDDCTRYSWLFVKPDRRVESLIQTFDAWLPWVQRQSGQMLLIIRTDNAREFKALETWGQPKGIEFEFIEPGTPAQNGVAERFNKSVLEIARALLFDAKIHKKYWKYAVLYANYLRNRTTMIKNSEGEDGRRKTPHELWMGYPPDLSNLRAWGCRVLYHDNSLDTKLDSRVAEGTFLMYGKSDKQYYVLPRGGNELRLVTSPEFRERERGYLDPPGESFGHDPAPELPKYTSTVTTTMRGGLITSGMPMGSGLSRETAPINAPIMNEDKRQPVMPTPVPAEAPKEQEKVIQPLESEQRNEINENGAEPTPERPASPHGSENEDTNAMDVDNERPSTAQLEGEKETLKEPTPGQPSGEGGYGERSYPPAMESLDNSVGEPREGQFFVHGRNSEPDTRRSDKVEERQDKVTPQAVNEEEDGGPRRSSRIRRPTEGLIESHEQQQKGHKRKTEGEEISDRPAQRLRARLAKLEVATELLQQDREFEVNEEARAAREKAGIRLPKSYNDAINDPVYGSKWREAIHKELSALISFGTWNIIRRSKASGTIATTRWVFDVKLGPDGRIERFKARLVARGNEQSDDDFEETFAPVF